MDHHYSLFVNSGTEFLVAHNTHNIFTPIPHPHPQYEIYYNVSGNDSYLINNRFISVKPYDLLIVPKLHIHKSIRNLKSNYETYLINFSDNILNTILNLPMIGDENATPFPFINLEETGKTLPYKVHLNSDEHQYIVRLFEECRRAEQSHDNLTTLVKFIEIMQFINIQFQNAPHIDYNDFEPTRWSDKVLQYIEQHLNEDISGTQIAEALYINRTHLLEIFKEEIGLTLHNYITIRRLAEAQKMLYEGISIADTAKECGFTNISHFTKNFRQKLGFTPSSFRKKHFSFI